MSEADNIPELSDGARELLASYKAGSPAAGRAKGNWAAIQASLAATAATATAATAAKAATGSASIIKWVLIGTAVLGAGGGAVAWAVRSGDDAEQREQSQQRAARGVAPPEATGNPQNEGAGEEDTRAPALVVQPESDLAPQADVETPTVAQADAALDGETGEPKPKARPTPPKNAPQTDVDRLTDDADRLAGEAALVASIQDAVVREDWKQVETLSKRHAKEFGDGVMKIERMALQTVGRCRSGDGRGAKAAETFLKDHGGSPHAAKVSKACDR